MAWSFEDFRLESVVGRGSSPTHQNNPTFKQPSPCVFKITVLEKYFGSSGGLCEMGSADRLFNRQRSVRAILGGGLVADVILWRSKNLSRGILLVALAAWVVFERSGYTLVSLVSSVLLLLITLLFLWARSAAILNRPAPPLPEMQVSAEMMEGIASLIRTHVNCVLSAFRDIALGKDSGLYLKVSVSLFLLSVLGGLTDFLTLGYTSLIVVFTIPAMYEKYEAHVDGYTMKGYHNLVRFYAKLYGWCSSKVQQWIAEAKKLN